MHRYRHIGPYGRIHAHLIVGEGIVVRVDRAGREITEGAVPAPAESGAIPRGATVHLELGDVLVTTEPYEHPELIELDPPLPVERPPAVEGRRAPAAPPRRRQSPGVPAPAAPAD